MNLWEALPIDREVTLEDIQNRVSHKFGFTIGECVAKAIVKEAGDALVHGPRDTVKDAAVYRRVR